MDIIDIKPKKIICLKLEQPLQQKLLLTNLTFHQMALYLVSTHPSSLSIHPQNTILGPFQQLNIGIIGNWNESLTANLKGKIRVFIWKIQNNEIEQQHLVKKMFSSRKQEQSTLRFEEIQVIFDVNRSWIKLFAQHQQIQKYSIKQVSLGVERNETPDIVNQAIKESEKFGIVKSIDTYPQELVIQFVDLKSPVCDFIQLRDSSGDLFLYSVTKIFPNNSMSTISLENQRKQKELIKKGEQYSNDDGSSLLNNNKTQEKAITQVLNNNLNLTKDEIRKSFLLKEARQKKKSLNCSQKNIPIYEYGSQFDYPTTQIDVDTLKQLRYENDIKVPQKQFPQKTIELTKPILSCRLSQNEKHLFVLLQECLLIFSGSQFEEKAIIQFDGLSENCLKQQIPTLVHKNFFIFGNECYLYWINCKKHEVQKTYVQRKSIHALAVLDQISLLAVGGKTHSKLSYFGKTTTRTNIKLYSCKQADKHAHLSTFDIPNCESATIQALQSFITKPANVRVLCALTSNQQLHFFRVKSHQQIQTYAQFDLFDLDISKIQSLKSWKHNLICVEQLDQGVFCFKCLKINCLHKKIDVLTELIELPYGNYRKQFTFGGEGEEQLIAIQKFPDMNYVHYFDFEKKQITMLKESQLLKKCYKTYESYIDQYDTSLIFHSIKSRQ